MFFVWQWQLRQLRVSFRPPKLRVSVTYVLFAPVFISISRAGFQQPAMDSCSLLQDRFLIAHSRQIRVIYHPDPIRITSFRPSLVRFLSGELSSPLSLSPFKKLSSFASILLSLLSIPRDIFWYVWREKKKKILMDLNLAEAHREAGLLTPGNLDSTMHVCVLARAEHSYNMWMERCREERFVFVFSIFWPPTCPPESLFFQSTRIWKGKRKKKNILLYFVSSKQKLKI